MGLCEGLKNPVGSACRDAQTLYPCCEGEETVIAGLYILFDEMPLTSRRHRDLRAAYDEQSTEVIAGRL